MNYLKKRNLNQKKNLVMSLPLMNFASVFNASAAKMSSAFNCRLLHIKVISICSKLGRHIDIVANSLEPDQTPSYSASGLVPSCLQRPDNREQQDKG